MRVRGGVVRSLPGRDGSSRILRRDAGVAAEDRGDAHHRSWPGARPSRDRDGAGLPAIGAMASIYAGGEVQTDDERAVPGDARTAGGA